MANDSDHGGKNGTGNGAGDDDTRRVVSISDARSAMRARAAANDAPHQPVINLPPVIKSMCLLIVAVFALQQLLPAHIEDQLVWWGGFIPARYSGALPFDIAALWSPVTHALLHGGWLHFGMNIGMLMAFGAGLEKQRGGKSLLVIFTISVLGGAAAQFILAPDSAMPMIGASGGISGLFGAALMLMAQHAAGHGAPLRAHLRHMLPFVAVWIGISVFFGMVGMPGASEQPIAWAAHVGGFIAGIAATARKSRA